MEYKKRDWETTLSCMKREAEEAIGALDVKDAAHEPAARQGPLGSLLGLCDKLLRDIINAKKSIAEEFRANSHITSA